MGPVLRVERGGHALNWDWAGSVRQSNMGTKGESQRPYGKSTARDVTSVDPQDADEK